jgi:glycosyltransferase involved in cell wall biosynthesis
VNARRIVVNGAIHEHGITGSSRATTELTRALAEIPNTDVREVRPPGHRHSSSVRNALRDAYWDLHGAARQSGHADLLVSPCNFGRRGPAGKHLLVVYDSMIYDSPLYFDPKFVAYFRALLPVSMRTADRVLTLSDHARVFLSERFPGVDVRVVTLPAATLSGSRACWRASLTVLMVGATYPAKNQVAGIDAVRQLRLSSGLDVKLRLIGPPGPAEIEVTAAAAAADPSRSWIRREQNLSDVELGAAYSAAWVLLQPSLDEGFGLPLVEAAQFGLPVVHSGRGGMPSVLGKSDAHGCSPEALCAALAPLVSKEAWQDLSHWTWNEAHRFTRANFAAQVLELVSDLLPASGVA